MPQYATRAARRKPQNAPDAVDTRAVSGGRLYVVATPIGNLDDLSPRAARVLAEVDLVAAEDTRRTGRLLAHAGISAEQVSLHEHNEEQATARLLAELGAGRTVALVSDAGTPLVSDPGYRLLAGAHAAGVPVSPVPGPSALLAALSVAGLPTDRFCFEGFLPSKAAARRSRLAELAAETRTLVFFASVHRIADTLADLAAAFGAGRRAFVGRELSKLHEQCVAATAGELAAMAADGRLPAKGEFVVVCAGAPQAATGTLDVDELLRRLAPLLPHRQAVEIAAAASGRRRNELYRRLLELTGGD